MSGFSASSSVGGAPCRLLDLLRRPAPPTVQSATAAAQTATSAGSAASAGREHLLAPSPHGAHVTPGGSGSPVGPATRTSSAPRRARAAAMAWPCLPDERLAMKRTGIDRLVGRAAGDDARGGPASGAVGRDQRPRSPPGSPPARPCGRGRTRCRPWRPRPGRPCCTPRACQRGQIAPASRAWCHIRTFIAGAISTGLSVASRAVVARSSAMPLRHLGHDVGGGGRHHQQVGLARQLDMAHLALVGEREQVAIDLRPR